MTVLNAVTATSTWRFRNSPHPQPGDWCRASYDASAWRSGRAPFWHGNPGVGTYLGIPRTVTYFRTTFDLVDAAQVTAAVLTLRADDGAVAYLNGMEVCRVNMPAGVVTHSTPATRADTYGTRGPAAYAVKTAAFATGVNVLAVELHQAGDGSWVPGLATLTATLDVTVDEKVTPPPPTGQWVEYWSALFGGSSLPAGMGVITGPYGNPVGSGCDHIMVASNVTVSGGYCQILASREPITVGGRTYGWRSGMLDTRSVGRYFPRWLRVEVRALVPHTVGIWPGLWLRSIYGASKGEPDIMEALEVALASSVTQTLWLRRGETPTSVRKQSTIVAPGWHTYTVQVVPTTPGSITSARFAFEIDGTEIFSYVDTEAATWATLSDPMKCWDFAAQIYVGSWGGTPAPSLTSSEMLIDSVRVLVPNA